ncbi:peptide/nickel transport system substrate-binding protein [Acetitomaculum ruminis DSM 5522]|uniref:Peptide/nickel transport system substrate-binding protein n=1 Tax=Acetitomaculum ruminis DSM 5522 TaxID=1120918 RepID=A0A1I1A9U0_9FIRM|nr:ABC transporter substrate-binding protein [Acetitomaculum ruminis]SFB34749.1 peptide/nickel transport system substrate-binding protein [Acetitomaculum ruminis DSM 5522]
MKKKMLCMLMALTLTVSALAGCGTGKESTDSSQGKGEKASSTSETSNSSEAGELKYYGQSAGYGLDPGNQYNGWYAVEYGVVETLFKLDDNFEIQPWIADSYELSDDHLTWTVKLKEGITFQNGKELDAEAVKKSLQHTLDTNDRAPSDLAIESMEADGLTIKFTTKSPNPAFINSLTEPYSAIIDMESGKDFDKEPIGTGPYMVKEVVPDEKTEVVAYADYWGGAPKLSKATDLAFKDNDAVVMAMQSGEIDAAYAMSYDGQELFANDDNYAIDKSTTSRIYMLYYNMDNENLSDAKVRKALNMLIDKESYGSVVMNGNGEPATGMFPENTEFGKDLKATEFDVDGAKKLLEEAGYSDSDNDGFLDKDGKKLSFRIVTYSSRAELPLIADAMQSQFKEVGIDSDIKITDDISTALKAGDYDICPYSFTTLPTGDPGSLLNSVFAKDGSNNFAKYNNETVNGLIEQINNEFDADKRNELVREAMQTILDEDAFCFIEHLKMSVVTKSTVENLNIHPLDFYQLDANVSISK